MDFWDEKLRSAVRALIPTVEGKPCVNVGEYDGGVYYCRRISGLHTDDDSFNGECEWVDPEHARPGELTDGMSISCDCVRLGSGWWQDTYFGWYFVYDQDLVARTLAGDHSWVQPFLDSNKPPKVEASQPPPGLSHRLLPREAGRFLNTEEVVNRLRGEFPFFAASPHQSPDEQSCTFSVVLAEDPESMVYLNFEVRPNAEIVVRYRDEQHITAARSLLERCALLLDYDFLLQ
jgi:hypothetical protein